MTQKLNVGLIGFGLSGRVFHASLLKALDGFAIRKVVTSRADTVREHLPTAETVESAAALISDPSLDLIINSAPNEFHYSHSLAALEAGKHVVVEKPFATTSDECRKLIAKAEEKKRLLTVFHNRRWDSDFLTVRKLVDSGKLGEPVLFESHFDRYRPLVRPERWRERAGAGSGILFDLGAHLIDQALVLFGMPERIFADLESQKGVRSVVDYFHLILYYETHRVILHGDSFGDVSPRFRIQGRQGSYVKQGLDPQERQLSEGMSPLDQKFGVESPSDAGALVSYECGHKRVEAAPSLPGAYLEFYRQLHRAIVQGESPPVRAEEALNVIRLIELADQSSKEGRAVSL